MKRIYSIILSIAMMGVYSGTSLAQTLQPIAPTKAEETVASKKKLQAKLRDIAQRRKRELDLYRMQVGNITEKIHSLRLEMTKEELKGSGRSTGPASFASPTNTNSGLRTAGGSTGSDGAAPQVSSNPTSSQVTPVSHQTAHTLPPGSSTSSSGSGPVGGTTSSNPLLSSSLDGAGQSQPNTPSPFLTGGPSGISFSGSVGSTTGATTSNAGTDTGSEGAGHGRTEHLRSEIAALEHQLVQLTKDVQEEMRLLQSELDSIEPTTEEERQLIANETIQIQTVQTIIEQEISTGISMPTVPIRSELTPVSVTPTNHALINGAVAHPPHPMTGASNPSIVVLGQTSLDGADIGRKPGQGWWSSMVSLVSGGNKSPEKPVIVGGFWNSGTSIGGAVGNPNPAIQGNLGQGGGQKPFNNIGPDHFDPMIAGLMGSGGGGGGNPHDYSPTTFADPRFVA